MVAILAFAGTAHATAFTLSSSVSIDDATSGVLGNIIPDSTTSGTVACLDPGVSCLDTDFLVVRVSLDPGSADVDEVGISVLVAAFISGIGSFTDVDVDPSGGAIVLSTQGRFDFDAPRLTAGDLSDPIFISFASGTLSAGQTASFMVQPFGGLIYSPTGTIVEVPEAGTALLLGSAALALAGWGARRRKRA